MNLENERPYEEELTDRLWCAINIIQAMADRLRAQCEKSLRGQGADAYSLASLAPV